MFAFFLLAHLSTYPLYKESRPMKGDKDARGVGGLSWRSFKHDSLTSRHTRSAPHVTSCKTESEDWTAVGSRKILPANPSEFVVTSNWHQPWLSRAEKNKLLQWHWIERRAEWQLGKDGDQAAPGVHIAGPRNCFGPWRAKLSVRATFSLIVTLLRIPTSGKIYD